MAKNEKLPRRFCMDCGTHIESEPSLLGRGLPLCIGCDDLLRMQLRIRKDAGRWVDEFVLALNKIAEREMMTDKAKPKVRPMTLEEANQLDRPLVTSGGRSVHLHSDLNPAPMRRDGRSIDAPAASAEQRRRERSAPR